MRWLEEEVTRITGKNDQMLKENLLLRQVLNEQGQKIQELIRAKQDAIQERMNIKTEKEEAEPPKKALWRPGIDTPSKPKRTTTDDHLTKMRLNIMNEHSVSSQMNPITPTPTYNHLAFDQVKYIKFFVFSHKSP